MMNGHTTLSELIAYVRSIRERVSPLVLRGFCLRCCHAVRGVMPSIGQRAIEVAAAFLSGQASGAELQSANDAIGDYCVDPNNSEGAAPYAANAAFHASWPELDIEVVIDCIRNAVAAGGNTDTIKQYITELT